MSSLANSDVGSSSSILFGSAITPPASFSQSLVPAQVPQIESGSESLPFSDPLLLRLSQPAEQSRARTCSSPPLGDGRQKCRLHVDRNRIPDSHESSLKTTPDHRLLRLLLLGNQRNETVRMPTVSNSVRAPADQDR